MKKLALFLLVLGSVTMTKAQTLEEFTRQKRVQTRYLVFQLSALKAHAQRLGKGYAIAKEGLGKLGQSAGKEFHSHDTYFNSLKTVSSKVRSHRMVSESRFLHKQVTGYCVRIIEQLSASGEFSSSELNYIRRVLDQVQKDCDHLSGLLTDLTTDYSLQMTDAERLEYISVIHKQMHGNYSFCQQFGNEAKILALSRKKEKKEIEHSRTLYGIKP